ncbi:MAG TPA: TPM domain-containing protein, partial [bacterium]|nr:TPM domain-containing protein [bacterium]
IDVEEFASRLFKQYGVGKKGRDNGILVLVARDDRRFRVEVGYGLEGTLPDALSKRLMDQKAVPRFKQGAFGLGLYDLGVALATKVAESEGVALNLPGPPEAVGSAEATQPLGLLDSPPAPSRWAEWRRWIGGLSLLGLTLLFIAWRTARFHLAPSKAGRRLAFGRSGTDFPVVLVLFAVAATFFTAGFGGIHVLVMLGGTVSAVGLWATWRKIYGPRVETYRRFCPSCRKPMQLINESEDDSRLKENEIAEEIAEGMDYEFWRCARCRTEERFDVKLPYADPCPRCQNRSLVTLITTVAEATYTSKGQRRTDKNCKYRACKFAETTYQTIPMKTRSSSSGGSGGYSGGGGGGSFGGGSSGGGGASGGW